jgi:hypothetical protein
MPHRPCASPFSPGSRTRKRAPSRW